MTAGVVTVSLHGKKGETYHTKKMSLMDSQQDLAMGDKAPDFSLPGTDGKEHSLQDYSGPVLIIFMCNHCPYVKPKVKQFIALQEKYPDVKLIGINSNESENYPEDSFENMKKFELNFPYLHDESQEVAKAYGAVCTPDPYLFDKDHKLVYHGRFDEKHGDAGNSEDMINAIDAMLKGNAVGEQKPSRGCSIKWKQST